MVTRSITRIQENGKTFLAIYRQYDGYLSGHGNDLAEFLADRTVVNGIRIGTERQVFNGPGCLAAQLVAFLKKDEYNKAGSIYIVPADSDSEEYDYNINLLNDHNIPLDTLVEVVLEDSPKCGIRGFVVEYDRDCDGEPLYVISFQPYEEAMRLKTFNYSAYRFSTSHGWTRDCLEVVDTY